MQESFGNDLATFLEKHFFTQNESFYFAKQFEKITHFLTFAIQQNDLSLLQFYSPIIDCELVDVACVCGNTNILKWLIQNGGTFVPSSFYRALESNNIELLQWVKSYFHTSEIPHLLKPLSIHTLKWLKQNGFSISGSYLKYALADGNIKVLDWLKQHGSLLGDGSDFYAALSKKVSVLEWLKHHGGYFSESMMSYLTQYGTLDMLKWLKCHQNIDTTFSAWSIQHVQSVEMLEWLVEHYNISLDETLFENSIRSNNLDVIRWLRDHHCKWSKYTVYAAIVVGNYELIQWFQKQRNFQEQKISEDIRLFNPGFKQGFQSIQTLEWLREKNGFICNASKSGNLNILKWLQSNQIPIDAGRMFLAIRNGEFDVVKWLVEHNNNKIFTHSSYFTRQVLNERCSLEMLEWLMDQKSSVTKNHWQKFQFSFSV